MNFLRILRPKDSKEHPPSSHVPTSTSHPVGAEVLVQGVEPITADIVFVHGLSGHRRDTWTKDHVCWPQELLSKEEALSHVRVLTLGYDANIVSPNGRASWNTLFEHSINLVHELSRERRKDARDRPIIFVAHSLGGLVVKDALNYSSTVQATHPHLAQIFSATRGIIFLGTPHRGTGETSITMLMASVAQIALQNPHFDLIRDLERGSQTLDRIGVNFGQILEKRTLAVWSFAEELPMTGIGKVVPVDSAIIGDPRENRETIYGDHISMVKFSTRDDSGYKKVLNSIEMLLEGLPQHIFMPNTANNQSRPHYHPSSQSEPRLGNIRAQEPGFPRSKTDLPNRPTRGFDITSAEFGNESIPPQMKEYFRAMGFDPPESLTDRTATTNAEPPPHPIVYTYNDNRVITKHINSHNVNAENVVDSYNNNSTRAGIKKNKSDDDAQPSNYPAGLRAHPRRDPSPSLDGAPLDNQDVNNRGEAPL